MKNKNILLRALLTGMLCITSLTIFTGCIDKKDGDGMVNGRTVDGELPENGDAEPVPIKANKAGKPEIKDSSTTEAVSYTHLYRKRSFQTTCGSRQ